MTVAVNDTIERYSITSAGAYPYTWRIFNETDLQVYALSPAVPPVPVLLSYLTHYTVSGANNAAGGSITLTAAAYPAYAGYTLDIRANTPENQPTSIRNIGRFLPEIHEDAYDYLSRQIQDLARVVNACVRSPDYEPALAMLLPQLANRAGKYIACDVNGQPTAASGTGNDSALRTDLANGLAGPGADLIAIRRTASEIAAGVIPSDYLKKEFDLARYGGDPTGAADSAPARAKMQAVIAASTAVREIEITPGTYRFDSQVNWVPKDDYRIKVKAWGVTFKSTGAISTVKVAGATTCGGYTFEGLTIDDHGNANVLAGIEIVGSSRTHLIECWFRPGGNSATYKQAYIRNSTAADPNTGAFWCHFERCVFRRLSALDGTAPTYNIYLQGAANATRIICNELGDADQPVFVTTEAGQTYTANGVLSFGNAYEGYTHANTLSCAAAVANAGFRDLANRYEPGSTPGNSSMRLLGATVQPTDPTARGFNYWTPDEVNHLLNTNSLYVFSLDSGSTGSVAPSMDTWAAVKIKNRSGNGGALDLQTGLDNSGLVLREAAGSQCIIIKTQTGGFAELISSANSMRITGLRGISQSGVHSQNFAGSMAFAASTTATQGSLATEGDTGFKVLTQLTTDPGSPVRIWLSAKTTTSFTLTSSAAITANLDWHIVR